MSITANSHIIQITLKAGAIKWRSYSARCTAYAPVQLSVKPGQGSPAEKALDSIIWCNWSADVRAAARCTTF